jgi:class 3 adenylate cyclase
MAQAALNPYVGAMETPTTRYARSGEASIAYQVVGEGDIDMLFVPGWTFQVEHIWEGPPLRRYLERIAEIARLIIFDPRGSGLSDAQGEGHTLEDDVRDALAVLDAAGSERAAIYTRGLGGPVGILLAADHPERVSALVMYGSVARTTWAPDYDWAMKPEERAEFAEQFAAERLKGGSTEMRRMAPSLADDPAFVSWWSRFERLVASPSQAREQVLAAGDYDVRDALPRVHVPTLVMHRPEELNFDVRHSRYLAEHIEGARYVELEGKDSVEFAGDSDAIIEEIAEFLTGVRRRGEGARALLTLMFTDIVDSTKRAAELGDQRWRDLLAHHDEAVRRQISRFGGREVKTMGDGFLVSFSGPPSSALRCAQEISAAVHELGIEVRIGVHTGECELTGDDVGGMAVNIAARVMGLAGAGEVLASGAVAGAVVGGPFSFEERGAHELKGVPGRWPVFSLQPR